MKLKLLFTDDTAELVGVAVADTGEPVDGVKSTEMNLEDGTVTIVLDLDRVKLGNIKAIRIE